MNIKEKNKNHWYENQDKTHNISEAENLIIKMKRKAFEDGYKAGKLDQLKSIEVDNCNHEFGRGNANPYKTEYTCEKCGFFYED